MKMRSALTLGLLVTCLAGLPLAARATDVVLDPPSLTFAQGATTPKTVGVLVKGLPDARALCFASFQLGWDPTALQVAVASWGTTVLDVAGVTTPAKDGANFSAARVKATGGVKPGTALLTLKVTPKPGKTGDYTIRFKPASALNVLHGPTGLPLPVASWASLPVTIGGGVGGSGPLVTALAVTSASDRAATITYSLSADASVSVEVRNLAGRLVRTVVADHAESAGLQSQVWTLTNDQGLAAPTGVYVAAVTVATADGRQERLVQAFRVAR